MLGKLDKSDHKYFIEGGDEGFSPARNKKVIDDTIKLYEKNRAAKMAVFQDHLRERTSAIASFLTSDKGPRYAGYTDSRIVKYFGKRYLAELQGKSITERINNKLNVIRGSRAPSIITPSGKIRGKKVSDVRKKAKKRKK